MRFAGGLAKTILQNLRTEIVLRDANNVAFWFSFSFPVTIFRQLQTGKRGFPGGHLTRIGPKALFPGQRQFGEKLKSVEDESPGKV
jgi:hypothetical protein